MNSFSNSIFNNAEFSLSTFWLGAGGRVGVGGGGVFAKYFGGWGGGGRPSFR